MRFLAALFLAVTLAACEAPPTQPGPASPMLDQLITDAVAEANADRGRNLGDGLIVQGARAEGNTMIITFMLTENIDALRSVSRADLETVLGAAARSEACSDPNVAAFIGIGGRLQMNFIDPARQPLAATIIDRC